MTTTATGRTIWITGLSAAGKSTLAAALVTLLREDGKNVILLDGDELREVFGTAALSADNHDRQARLALAMQYAHLCRILSAQGFIVVIATISLFREVHRWNREHLPGYFEVYLDVPVDELRRRDPKGIYRRFDAGELVNVAGLDLQVDTPDAADWLIAFEAGQEPQSIAKALMNRIREENAA